MLNLFLFDENGNEIKNEEEIDALTALEKYRRSIFEREDVELAKPWRSNLSDFATIFKGLGSIKQLRFSKCVGLQWQHLSK